MSDAITRVELIDTKLSVVAEKKLRGLVFVERQTGREYAFEKSRSGFFFDLEKFADPISDRRLGAWSYDLYAEGRKRVRASWPKQASFPFVNNGLRTFKIYSTGSGKASIRSLRRTGLSGRAELPRRTPDTGRKRIALMLRQISSGAGQTTAIISIANMLAFMGHDVTVLALWHSEREPVLELRPDVAFDFIDGSIKNTHVPADAPPSELVKLADKATKYTDIRLCDHLALAGYDAIYVPAFGYGLYRMVRENTDNSTLLILGDHEGARTKEIESGAVTGNYRYAINHFDAIHTVSSNLKNAIESITPKPTFFIENCLGRKPYEREPIWSSRTIVCAGRLTEEKGIPTLVRSFCSLSKETTGWKLQLLGRGESALIEEIKALAKEHGCLGRLDLVGFTDNPMLYLSKAAISASASLTESFGLSILEAMAAGCLVVSYDGHDGAKLLLKDNNAFLAAHEDENDFTRALREAMKAVEQQSPSAQNMIEKSAAIASGYGFEPTAMKWETQLDKLFSARG